MPLNIDWQQILLHWLNLIILTGGLYFLLYDPVKQFMAKREEYYKDLERQAQDKLAQADEKLVQTQAKLDAADEEIRQHRVKAQESIQQSIEEQMNQAKAEAAQIVRHAHVEAEHDRDKILHSAKRELRDLAVEATRKMALEKDPFNQFLDLAEEGGKHDSES